MRVVRRSKARFASTRAAWMDVAKATGHRPSDVSGRRDTATHFVFVFDGDGGRSGAAQAPGPTARFVRTPPEGASFEARERRLTASIIDLREREPGGPPEKGRPRFPIATKAEARNALARLPIAKNLPSEAKRRVAQRAANVLQKVTPGAERFGVERVTMSRPQAIDQAPLILGRHRSTRRMLS